MNTCIKSHKRFWHTCSRWVNAGRNIHTQPAPSAKKECNYLNGWIKKIKRSHTQKSRPQMVNSRDIAGERRRRRSRKSYLYAIAAFCVEILDVCNVIITLRPIDIMNRWSRTLLISPPSICGREKGRRGNRRSGEGRGLITEQIYDLKSAR